MKPCPFCGSTNLETIDHGDSAHVECLKCEASGPFINQYEDNLGGLKISEEAERKWEERNDS